MNAPSSVGGVSTAQATSAGSGIADYLKQLKDKHPNLQIRVGTVSESQMPEHGAGDGNLMIDPRYLAKMAADPETAKKGEEMLSSIPKAEQELKDRFAAMGHELLAHGFSINKDGNMGTWVSGRGDGPAGTAGLLAKATDKEKTEKNEKDKTKAASSATENLLDELRRIQEKKKEESAAAGGPVEILA